MRRINYIIAPTERIFGYALRPAVTPPLRTPVAAVVGAFMFLALPYAVETTRLHHLERSGAALEAHLAATALEVRRVHGLARDVSKLRSLSDEISSIRRSGEVGANEIAALGNQLPRDAWLTALRRDGAALDVEGITPRVSTVAAAIAALARLPRYTGARLVAVRGEAPGSAVSYSIVLEPRR